MRLSQSASISSSKRRNSNRSGSRSKKKHKRLDAICEKAYNQNRAVESESNDGNGGAGSAGVDSELRRSSRVRRAPVMLDASPPPAKKRRKIDKNGERLLGKREKENERDWVQSSPKCENSGDLEEPGSWKSRLRSRVRNLGFKGKGKKGDSPLRGKRKLFENLGGFKEEEAKLEVSKLDGKEEGIDGGKSTVVKSKRPGRIKASNVLRDGEKEIIELNSVKEREDQGRDEMEEMVANKEDERDEGVAPLEIGMVCGNEGEMAGNYAEPEVEKEESEIPNGLRLEECIGNGNDNADTMERTDQQLEHLECVKEGENQGDGVEVGRILTNGLEDGGSHDCKDACLVRLDEKSLVDGNARKVDMSNGVSSVTRGKRRVKEGRRCGLCGGGTDGKPPKRLAEDMAESENEACSGSSASEEPNYDVWDGFGDEPGWLGRLLGPINDRFGIAGIWVHQHCAVWSPEVYFAGLGCLKNVRAALCRGRALKCSRCGRPGATIGCRVDRCPKTYHLPCARANGCIFDHRKFLIACTYHRHLFQPHGNQYLHRIKKMKAKKMKLEIRKLTNDAWRKDLEAEEKWLENCGEDEEFLKRESRRLHRDILRIAPVYIGGSDSDSGKLFQGWESVAGLQDVIQCLKEVVILPLLYPEFFTNLGLTPPRGVLLHGYPGTGKTLVVRALIGSCARGDKRIAYFARKGADCLGKYVGDAERQLRLLFQVAERSQPSIIFFDEIDGLAPCRTRQQDQTHSSVVSTLLALLDGLKSRGSVVVIGATNRPEAVDPALRRPGRFDREIYFPLPSVNDRASILSLHTQRWPKPVAGSLLKWIARRTAGFAGADLQALCTQAAIIALKRNCPLQELLSAAGEKPSNGNRVPLPAFAVEERDWLEALSCAPPPCSRREAGMAANDVVSSPLPTNLVPCLLPPLSSLIVSLYLDERVWLPPPLSTAATMIKSVIISALDKKKVPSDSWLSHVNNFLQEADIAKEIERKLSCVGVLIEDAGLSGSDVLNDDSDDHSEKFEFSKVHNDGCRSSLLQNISYASGKKSGFRILIAGSHRSGQRHLASCLLHCFVGNVEIQKVDLATLSQEGHGDVLLGLTQILMKCASVGSCIVFMPRIDLWAMDSYHQVDEKESDSGSINHQPSEEESCLGHGQVVEKDNESSLSACESAEIADPQDDSQSASHIWSSFVEQVDSICMSTSLMILATSELPYRALPLRVRQFFKCNISTSSHLTHPEHTVPRFSVQVGGNFNHDMVISSSAAKLSRDVFQQFVQFIHHRTHTHTSSCREYKTCNTIEGNTDVVGCSPDHRSANEHEGRTQPHEDSLIKVPLPPSNRTVRGKSNLLLAISTFGYQILRYPHFAELCWVTSKLKDGPCVDISGPWKGWPFNTCIVRPNNSLEKVAAGCSSSNIKSQEKSGLVRGLIAVGLSAYRGAYTSLREISFEVRKVLELVVEQINAKILAGKDRYQFIRILSQVAYLEDMVNSWQYTLQSLELDAQVTVANLKLTSVVSPVNYDAYVANQVRSEECKSNVSNRRSHESGALEESPHGFVTENIERVDLNNGDGEFGCPNFEGRATMPEGPPQQMVFLGHSAPDIHVRNFAAAADRVDVKILNEQNGTNSGSCRSENTGNSAVVNGDFGTLKHSNGSALTESVAVAEEGHCSSGELAGIKFSGSGNVGNQINGLSSMETSIQSEDGKPNPNENVVSSNKTTNLSAGTGFVCLYCCCAECLHILHSLMQKILMNEWELKGSNWTVDDVHDIVTSLSVNLLSAFRKACGAENFRNSIGKKPRHENQGNFFECQEIGKCQCKNSENKLVMPMKCSRHLISGSLTAKENASPLPQLELETKFIYRDGVLAPVEPDKDVSFHCKFETLCLCSLIEWIVTNKQPLD